MFMKNQVPSLTWLRTILYIYIQIQLVVQYSIVICVRFIPFAINLKTTINIVIFDFKTEKQNKKYDSKITYIYTPLH